MEGENRLFRPVKQKRPSVNVLYFFVVVAIVAFAAPKLRENIIGWHGVFKLAWLFFALLVMASNLWFALGVQGEQKVHRKERLNTRLNVLAPGTRANANRKEK